MYFSQNYNDHKDEILDLFNVVFSASEGKEEGKLISLLVNDIFMMTDPDDLAIFMVLEEETLLGCIIFSVLEFPRGRRQTFLLSPVAVKTSEQGKGIGQSLINYGLEKMKDNGAEITVTYGDPAYYSKTGFNTVSQTEIKPPFNLSQPHGWMAKCLTEKHFLPLVGQPKCIKAFDRQDYW